MVDDAYTKLVQAARRWRVLRENLAMMEQSQSDEGGFLTSEIEPFRLAFEEAEGDLQLAVDRFGELSADDERAILFPGLKP